MKTMSEVLRKQSPSPEGEGRPAPPFKGFAPSTGFRTDLRFAAAPAPLTNSVPDDPEAIAYAEGYAAGSAETAEAAAQLASEEAQAREALALSFARLDNDMAELLRQRLRDTVAALCESALAPLALDEAALLTRIEAAAAMFARADDERVIRLNPSDLALVSSQLTLDWSVQPDPTLPRGSLRVETASGGVEDGPDQWRRAIAEALAQC